MFWRVITLSFILFQCLTSWAEDPKFRIGVISPHTGNLAEYGEAVQNGIELAKLENPDVDKYLTFIFEDDQYKPKVSVSAFNKLKNTDNVHTAYVWGVEPCLAVAAVAELQKFPLIAGCQHIAASKDKDYVIRFINSGDQYSRILLEHLRTKGIKEFAYIGTELSFFIMLYDGLKQHKKDEKIVFEDTFLPEEADFRSTITKLKQKGIKNLGLYMLSHQLKEFFEQAKELNAEFTVFGATPFDSTSVLGDSIKLMDGVVYAHNYVDEGFRERYVTKYGYDNHLPYAAHAYDFAVVSGQIAKENLSRLKGEVSSEEILSWYSKLPEGTGTGGKYNFLNSAQDGNYFAFDIAVKEINHGKAKEILVSR